MILDVFRGRKIPPWLAAVLLVGVGAVVFWPALTTPFYLDDYVHASMVRGTFPGVRGALSLYDFVGDDDRAALGGLGFLPWWTDSHLTLRFLRPLASLLLYYEHRWLGAWPLAMHLHSFAWWVAAVSAARALFRRLVAPRPAAFATVIFALAPCHALPIGWLANREALVALTFGTLGLYGFLRWLQGGGTRWAALSLLGFTLAFAAGEYAFGMAGYVAAFAWRTPADVKRRGWSVLLFAAPAAGYLAARQLLGYGAVASGFYTDPLSDTWLFLQHVPWRLAFLLLAGWFSQDARAWKLGDSNWPMAVALFVLLLSGCAALRHVGERQEPGARRTMWTLVRGSLLSLLPMLAVQPSVRLLGVAMLGIAPVIGLLLDAAWFGRETEARNGRDEWTAIAATLLGFAHLVHGPGRGWVNARQTRSQAVAFAESARDLATRVEAGKARDVVVVRGFEDGFFLGFALDALGVHGVHLSVLSHTGHVLLTRRDATTVDLVVGADAGLYQASGGDLYRSEAARPAPGDVLATGELTARIAEMGPVGPRKVGFRFEADVDDPRWLWVGESGDHRLHVATPPKVGFGVPFDP